MIKDKKLQVALLVGLTAVFGLFAWRLPNSYSIFNLVTLKIGIYCFIALVIISLILLALTQTSSNKRTIKNAESAYHKVYKGTIHSLIAVIIVTLAINASIYITPQIKDLINLRLYEIVALVFGYLMFRLLRKMGIKLFEK